jgi:hypothetical protein
MVVVSAIVPGRQAVWRVFTAKLYRERPDQVAAAEALARIPPDASVVAQSPIVPHLSHRDRIYMLQDGAPEADYVIASTGLSAWPSPYAESVDGWLEQRRQAGYQEIFAKDGWVVLRR